MLELSRYDVDMATVGENFRRIRLGRSLTQEQVCEGLGFRRVSNVSILERSKRLPKPRTIQRMAFVLDCEPCELMENVLTPYDALRVPGVPMPHGRTPSQNKSIRKVRGSAFAKPASSRAKTDPLPGAESEEIRRMAADFVSVARATEQAHAVEEPARTTRTPREHAPAARTHATRARVGTRYLLQGHSSGRRAVRR